MKNKNLLKIKSKQIRNYIQIGLPLKPIFGVHAGRDEFSLYPYPKISFIIIIFIQRYPGNPNGNPV